MLHYHMTLIGLSQKVTWSTQADCRHLIAVSSAPLSLLANSIRRAGVVQEGLFMFCQQNFVFLIQKTKIQQASVVFKIALKLSHNPLWV